MLPIITASQRTHSGVEKHHASFHGEMRENRVRSAQIFRGGRRELQSSRSSLHRPALALHTTHPRCFSNLETALRHTVSKTALHAGTDGCVPPATAEPAESHPAHRSDAVAKPSSPRSHVHFGVKSITAGKAARPPCPAASVRGFLPTPARREAKPDLSRWKRAPRQTGSVCPQKKAMLGAFSWLTCRCRSTLHFARRKTFCRREVKE